MQRTLERIHKFCPGGTGKLKMKGVMGKGTGDKQAVVAVDVWTVDLESAQHFANRFLWKKGVEDKFRLKASKVEHWPDGKE